MGMVLVKEDDSNPPQQFPVFYLSKVLKDAETRYPRLEKLAYGVIIAAQRPRHYFQSHPIMIRTDTPLRKVLQCPETSGRLAECALKLAEFDIRYELRKSLKAQVLADFVTELPSEQLPPPDPSNLWKIFADGSSNNGKAGIGVFIRGPGDIEFRNAASLQFKASNNVAEYEAFLLALRLAELIRPDQVKIFSDSKLVVDQISGSYDTRDSKMKLYLAEAKRLQDGIIKRGHVLTIKRVPREQNPEADYLAKLASSPTGAKSCPCPILVMEHPIIYKAEIFAISVTDTHEEWFHDILTYLQTSELPQDKVEATKTVRKANRYAVHEGTLYRKAFNRPWQRCVGFTEGVKILEEIHEGICGAHEGKEAIARKAQLHSLYWPRILQDAEDLVKKCHNCQQFVPILHSPAAAMRIIRPSWPFATWGIDLVGPFPRSKYQKKFLIVAVDHFTKWVIAEATTSVSADAITPRVSSKSSQRRPLFTG